MIRPASARGGGAHPFPTLFAAAVVLGTAAFQSAHAQGTDARPIRLVVPFAAGSYTDSVARIVVPSFAERMGATVVIDNRAGANGIIASELVARAAPDGHTLVFGGTSSVAVNPAIYRKLPYDPVKDLLPVVRSGLLPFMLVASPSLPVSTVPELIEHARRNPGKLAYATPNSITLMGMELFKRGAGVDILGVSYKSSPQAMLDMIANQVQLQIADYATAGPQIKAGKIRVLAVTMEKRSPLLPGVPAVAETIKGFDISAWNGLLAPGTTPPAVANRIAAAWQAVLATPDMRDRLAGIGFEISPLGPQPFAVYVRDQIAFWAKLAQQAGVKVD